MKEQRKSYPSDVSDEEWAFCVRYPAWMMEEARRRILRSSIAAVHYAHEV
jgi:hypothetical protein